MHLLKILSIFYVIFAFASQYGCYSLRCDKTRHATAKELKNEAAEEDLGFLIQKKKKKNTRTTLKKSIDSKKTVDGFVLSLSCQHALLYVLLTF